jgi:hypothetical protein
MAPCLSDRRYFNAGKRRLVWRTSARRFCRRRATVSPSIAVPRPSEGSYDGLSSRSTISVASLQWQALAEDLQTVPMPTWKECKASSAELVAKTRLAVNRARDRIELTRRLIEASEARKRWLFEGGPLIGTQSPQETLSER